MNPDQHPWSQEGPAEPHGDHVSTGDKVSPEKKREPNAKPPTGKRCRRGQKEATEEEMQNKKVEMLWKCDRRWSVGCRGGVEKQDKRKWEEEGQIKGRGKATITQNRLINGGLLSCGGKKTFLTNMLEPSSYWGLVKIYTTDAKWVKVCIVMPHYLKTRQQQSQDMRSSPSRSYDC